MATVSMILLVGVIVYLYLAIFGGKPAESDASAQRVTSSATVEPEPEQETETDSEASAEGISAAVTEEGE